MVEQEAGEEQAEEHGKAADEVGDAWVSEDDADEQAHGGGGEVEEDEEEHEVEELRPGGDEARHGVDDDAEDDGGDEAQRDNVKDDLGGEVGDGVVVALCALPDEEQALGGEDGQACECAEAE